MIISPSILTHDTNRGETELRKILLNAFTSKNYVALHSVGLSEHSEKPYSEADFVIITDFGIFCLEVKGGNVERRNGVWTIGYLDTGNYYESSDGPFKQASRTVDPILKRLRNADLNRANKFLIYWGVVFPHCSFLEEDTEWDQKQICDLNKINDFESYLKGLGKYTYEHFSRLRKIQNKIINKDDIIWASHVLRKDIVINENLNQLQISNTELVQLEKNQVEVLDQLFYGETRRMILSGGAGTGKTLLCNKVADFFSTHEFSILYLCFNKNLGIFLKSIFEKKDNVEVQTFHKFMEIFINNEHLKELRKERNYFDTVLLDLFEDKVIDITEDKKFDFLVIDEAQDILNDRTIEVLDFIIKGGFKDGNWFISIDEGVQSGVYNRFNEDTLNKINNNTNVVNRSLYRNYRNPVKVVEKANSIFPELRLPAPGRTFTSFVKKFSFVDKNDEQKKLTEIVKNLVTSKVLPQQITILTFKSKRTSFLKNLFKIFNSKLELFEKNQKNVLTWSNIGSFKGLENDYIIVVEAPETPLTENEKAILFVALTRCKVEFNLIHKSNTEIEEF